MATRIARSSARRAHSASADRDSSTPQRYRLHFPPDDLTALDQGSTYFLIDEDGQRSRVLFHDYAAIYDRPGLYEQLFYDRLKCSSPGKVTDLLHKSVVAAGCVPSSLRVLDVGAGNGMVGELLLQQGVSRVVGLDIIEEAALATERDRPGIYDAYYVLDLTRISHEQRAELASWNLDAMVCVAALGFGDIPVEAFRVAYNLVADGGWVGFNIKESFLDQKDESGFSRLVQRLLHEGYLELHHLERYCHRLSIEGQPLHYYALIGRKQREIDDECVRGLC